MNEQIKEIWYKAVGSTKDNSWGSQVMFMERFAELIIMQCGYHADVFAALGCPVDMNPTETKQSDYIKKQMGIS